MTQWIYFFPNLRAGLKKLNSASPAMTPPAKTSMPLRTLSPPSLSSNRRRAMPTATAQPAIGVKDQQASGQQHAELALRPANPLNECARNGPDKKLLRDTTHRARTDGGRVHLGHRRHHALRKIDAVRDVDHGNGDDEGQHRSDQLLLAACKL